MWNLGDTAQEIWNPTNAYFDFPTFIAHSEVFSPFQDDGWVKFPTLGPLRMSNTIVDGNTVYKLSYLSTLYLHVSIYLPASWNQIPVGCLPTRHPEAKH